MRCLKDRKMKTKDNTDNKPTYLGHRERLKTRFLKDNGASMPDYELLELLLTFAIARRDVKDDAKMLLKHFGSFANVLTASQTELADYGLTQNVIAMFKAVISSFKRLTAERLKEANDVIYTNIDYVIDYCKACVAEADVEEFHVLMFDKQLHLIKDALMQKGSVDSVPVYVREVVKEVVKQHVTSVVLFHNHPSGNCQPSEADIKLTKDIVSALKTIEIRVYDHLIISQNNYYSFHEHHLIDFM